MSPLIKYLQRSPSPSLRGRSSSCHLWWHRFLRRVWSGSRSVQSFAGCFRPTRSLSDIKGEMGSYGGLAR